MKRINRLRWGPVWAMVAVFVALVGSGWAQANQEDTFAFPYLSPSWEQFKTLANAFMFQMRLFEGLSSSGESKLLGLTFLGYFAVLVGALLIVFFQKYRSLPTILTWLFLVVVSLMMPLGSKMIFYPIKVKDPIMLSKLTDGDKRKGVHSGEDCKIKPQGCGFTPQLIAIHVASTLQVIVADVFKSTEWTGLIERMKAGSLLRSRGDFALSPEWFTANAEFTRECSAEIANFTEIVPGEGRQRVSSVNIPQVKTFKQQWDEIAKIYASDKSRGIEPPPLLIFPETLEQVKALGWGEDERSPWVAKYLQGLREIYRNIVNTNEHRNLSFSGTGDTLSVTKALDGMKNNKFFTVEPPTSWGMRAISELAVNPGFFMARQNDLSSNGGQSQPFAAARRCYVVDVNDNRSYWKQFKDGVTLQSGNYTSMANCLDSVSDGGYGGMPPTDHIETFQFVDGLVFKPQNNPRPANMPNPWGKFIDIMPHIQGMPMAIALPEIVRSSGYPAPRFAASSVFSTPSCVSKGRKLVDQAIDLLSNDQGVGRQVKPYFDKLVAMMRTGKGIPDFFRIEGSVNDITQMNLYDLKKSEPDQYALIVAIRDEMNEAIRQAGAVGDDTKKQIAIIRKLIDVIQDVTAQTYKLTIGENSEVAAVKAGSEMNPGLVGNEMLTSWGGWLGFSMGKVLIKIYAVFVGPFAAIYLSFIMVLVDLTLLALISLTPFLFLVGLMIPSTAAGVLTISVLSVAVLKFVPVTLVVLNALAGMVFDLLPGSVGVGSDLMRDLMIIGMAGIYTSLVGLTFYLMFKMGDPATFLGGLAQLDKKANESAEVGHRAMLATAAFAAGLVGRTALGVGGLLRTPKNEQDDQDNKPPEQPRAAEDMIGPVRPGEAGFIEKAEAVVNANTIPIGPQNMGPSFGDQDPGLTEAQEALMHLPADQRAILTNEARLNSQSYIDLGTSSDGRSMRGMLMSDGTIKAEIVPPRDSAGPSGAPTAAADIMAADSNVPQVLQDEILSAQNMDLAELKSQAAAKKDYTATDGSGNKYLVKYNDANGKLEFTRLADGAKAAAGVQTAGVIGVAGAAAGAAAPGAAAAAPAATTAAAAAAVGGAPAAQVAAAAATTAAPAAGVAPVATPAAAGGQQVAAGAAAGGAQGVGMKENYVAPERMTDEGSAELDRFSRALKNATEALDSMGRTSALMGIEDRDLSRKDKAAQIDKVKGAADEFMNFKAKDLLLLRGDTGRAARAWKSVGLTAWSSFSSAFTEGAGALSSIPIVGGVIKESLNEYTQGASRAQGWAAQGGWWKSVGNKTDAARGQFYAQEIAPALGAQQYRDMIAIGGMQGQLDIARQAAREAVQKSRSMYEAMDVRRRDDDKGVRADVVMNLKDLQGLGLNDAFNRLRSVETEAVHMKGQFKINVPVYENGALVRDSKGNIKMEEQDTNISHRILDKWAQNNAVKASIDLVDKSNIRDYSFTEKRYIRGGDWDKARDIYTQSGAVRFMMSHDPSRDYVHAGEVYVRGGKDKYMRIVEQGEFWNDSYRAEQQTIRKHVEKHGLLSGVDRNDVKVKYQLKPDVSEKELARYMYAEAMKKAKDNMPLAGRDLSAFYELTRAQVAGQYAKKLRTQVDKETKVLETVENKIKRLKAGIRTKGETTDAMVEGLDRLNDF